MTDQPTYYELLGIDPKASQADIKAAFRQHALRNHPDQGGNSALFRMLEEAYSTLTSPSKRQEYDVWLASVGHGTPPGGVRLSDYDGFSSSDWSSEHVSYSDREPREEEEEDVPPPPRYGAFVPPPAGDNEPGGGHMHVTARGFRARIRAMQTRILSNDGFLTRHGAFAVAMFKLALFGWIVFALAAGKALLPGVPTKTILFTLLMVAIVWIFTSLALRLGGWAVVLWALYQANNDDIYVSPWTTAQRLLLGVSLWLAGQWIYVFRHGKWHSLLAYITMRRWRGWLRPDRRFKPGMMP